MKVAIECYCHREQPTSSRHAGKTGLYVLWRGIDDHAHGWGMWLVINVWFDTLGVLPNGVMGFMKHDRNTMVRTPQMLSKQAKEEHWEQCQIVCWHIWKERCNIIFHNQQTRDRLVKRVDRPSLNTNNWVSQEPALEKETTTWARRAEGFIKINCDASYKWSKTYGWTQVGFQAIWLFGG